MKEKIIMQDQYAKVTKKKKGHVTILFPKKTTIKQISSDGIIFKNNIEIKHHHDQDCCEDVYAEWDSLLLRKDIFEIGFDFIDIKTIKEIGFLLNKILVCCYNEQNGYYSDNLSLVIKSPKNECSFSITGSTEDIYE